MHKFILKLLVILALLIPVMKTFAQTSITLVLKAPIRIDSVSVVDVSGLERHDLRYKDTLAFKFNKKAIDCYNVRYFVKERMYWKQLWLDSGKVTVEAHLSDTSHLVIDTVINSPVYYSVKAYHNQHIEDTLSRNDFMLKEIANNLENVRSTAIANDYINFNQNSRMNLLRLKDVLAKQRSDFSWFIFYQIGIARLEKLLAIKALNLSDFKFIAKKGQITPVRLSGYDYYLLDFWFLDCAPCRRDHLSIRNNLIKIRAKGINVISISTDEKAELHRWNQYLLQHSYRWDNYLEAKDSKLTDYLGLHAFPAYVLITGKGEIVGTYSNINDVYARLKVN